MTSLTSFWVVFGPVLAGTLGAIVFDMLDMRGFARTLASGLLVVAGVGGLYAGWTMPIETVFGTLVTGRVYSTVPGLIFLVTAAALAAAPSSRRLGVVTALAVMTAGGAAIAVVGSDLVTLLIGLETAALGGYALVSSGHSVRSDEASVKYFVQGAVATGLFLIGTAVLVGLFSPDPGFAAIASVLVADPTRSQAAVLGVITIVAAIAFKAGAAPFHSWAPDAYETAPPATSAVLAGGVKLAMVAALASFLAVIGFDISSGTPEISSLGVDIFPLVGVLAVLSIIIGSTVALTTRSYMRMLAYAGIAQVGYALIALAALNPTSAIVFTATYAVGTTTAFIAAEAFRRIDPDWNGSIEGLSGIGKRAPLVGAAVTLALISLAGIPPLLGFWGKFQAFGAAIVASTLFSAGGEPVVSFSYAALAVVGVLGSIVSLGYYGNVVKTMYFADSADEEHTQPSESRGGAAGAVTVVLAGALLVLGALPLIVDIPTALQGFSYLIQ